MSATATRRVVREGLERQMPFTLERAGEDATDDGLTLEGHAAVFNEPTVIDSWEGRFTEEIAPGAFKKTFRERTPVLQFDHGHHPLLGSIPIGSIKQAREDDLGAFVSARLHDNWLVQPVREAISEGSINGMSFRFAVVKEEWRDEEGKLIRDDEALLNLLWSDTDAPYRTLRELRVPELGPVVFPAYDGTDVGVRSTVIDLGRLRTDPLARKTLARALWVADGATVTTDPDDGEPRASRQHSAAAGTEPREPHSGDNPTSSTSSSNPAAALAAEMRAKLNKVTP
jgi:HK97 family phage prohead protease